MEIFHHIKHIISGMTVSVNLKENLDMPAMKARDASLHISGWLWLISKADVSPSTGAMIGCSGPVTGRNYSL